MVYWLVIIFIQSVLRCLYFWQLKEYRWDRFRDLFSTGQIKTYLLPTFKFYRPKITFKIILTAYVAVAIAANIANALPWQLMNYLLIYLFTPVIVAFSVALVNPIFEFFGWFVIITAKIKLLFCPKLTVIGITGSYGKSSTKTILTQILANSDQSVCSTPANVNTLIGVAKTVLRSLKFSDKYLVVEMGAYKRGEIKAICNLVKPKIGILTAIAPQHLNLFGSMENLIAAKQELVLSLPANGLAVFNGKNKAVLQLAKTFSTCPKIIAYPSKKPLATNLIGSFQQQNISLAVAVAKHLKLPVAKISSSLSRIAPPKTVLTQKSGPKGSLILDDGSTANPEGFTEAMVHASSLKASPKILITPGIIELGSQKQAIHKQLALQADSIFDLIIVTKPDIYAIFIQAKLKTKLVLAKSPRQLQSVLAPHLHKKALILIEGRIWPNLF